MNIDASEFPFVRLAAGDPGQHSADEALNQFGKLLARKQMFVFMSDGPLTDGNENVEDRKKVSLWMKANKAQIRSLVQAHLHVEPSVAKRLAARAFAAISEKFWGYPMIVVETTDEAHARAHALLAA